MINIVKRDGTKEPFEIEKIHRVINWAMEGLKNVSLSEIEINAKLNIVDGITSEQIHSVLIDSASNLIDEWQPDYQYVASRLLSYQLRKKVWGGHNPPSLINLIKKNIELGYYDKNILTWYSEEQFNELNSHINHDRDLNYTYCSIKQLCDKYLVKNQFTNELYETPQFRYMIVALTIFHQYNIDNKENSLDYVKRIYDCFSKFKINLATPQLAGLGTINNSSASCLLIEQLDDKESINAANYAVAKATCMGYGIGVNFGRMRGIKSPVRNGTILHPGVVPFLKITEANTKAWQKNGVRGGSETVNFPIWHSEIETVVQLKNSTSGTHDSRVFNLDYVIGISKLFYERFIKNESITLFSPHEVPGLYDAFGLDSFDDLYRQYESDNTIKSKKTVKARELISSLVKERLESGRIYIINIDNVNKYGTWLDKVNMTNLCVAPETLLLTDSGYVPIINLDGKTVNLWNGKNWSQSLVKKTGENQKLLKVILSDGSSLDCTEYHKWYTVKDYNDIRRNKSYEVMTKDLNIGDKLIKFNYPIIDGNEKFKSPYTHGFFCGDGTYERANNEGNKKISLYDEKMLLIDHLDLKKIRDKNPNYPNKIDVIVVDGIEEKFVVPLQSSVDVKLKWFAGYVDADGSIARNGTNDSLQVNSINLNFLNKVQLLLQTLGVPSKINLAYEEQNRFLPDGNGGEKEYLCQKLYRLLVSSYYLNELVKLGFNPKRLQIGDNIPDRNASQYVTVTSIVDEGRISDTYCCNEPEEHKAVFNGILTGNCVEVTQAIEPLRAINDELSEIGVCVLSAVNWLEIKSEEDLEESCDLIVRMLDEIIDHQDYFDVSAKNFCQNKRSLGVGITNLAAFLAKHKMFYSNKESLELVDEWMEKQQYYLIKASINLAKEKGICKKFNTSKYSQGFLPVDKIYKENLVNRKPSMDWEGLRVDLLKHGMRHCTLSCQMPVESSSACQNATNGVEPARSLKSYKSSKKSSVPFLVPNIKNNSNWYELAFNMPDNVGYLNICCTIQKWMDMAMSVNQYFCPSHYPDKKIPYSQIIKDILHFYKMGGKCMYYCNTNDENKHFTEENKKGCDSGACTL